MFVLSRVQLFGTPLTVAHQALLSMGFPKQEYWSGNEYISYSQESYQPRDWTYNLLNPTNPGMPPTLVGRFFTIAPA